MRVNSCIPWLCCLLIFVSFCGTALGEAIITCVNGIDGTVSISSNVEGLSSDRPHACQAVTLPVTLARVHTALWLPDPLPGETGRLVMEGKSLRDEFLPRSIYTLKPESPPHVTALPIDLSLIDSFEARPFGLEERVTASRVDRGIVITCDGGSKPAGLILDPGARRLPDGVNAKISWETIGDDGFLAGVSSPGGSPRTLVALAAAGSVSVELPTEEKARATPWFVINCPKTPASLTLIDVRLAPQLDTNKKLQKGAWAWKPMLWQDQSEGLLQQAKALGLTHLFVSVDMKDNKILEHDKFANFVATARGKGLGITVVEGDPAMALSDGRTIALDRLKVLNAYQAQAMVEGRIVGVQYDIEPYLLPGFAQAPEPLLMGWATTLEALASATSLDLDIVVPFWLPFLDPSASLILPSLQLASRITVMAYRTEGSAIQAIAEPFLAWSTRVGVPAQIALESGPVDDEIIHIFERAKVGELLLEPQAGGAIALLLDAPHSGGSQHVYALSSKNSVPGGRISFLGNPERLGSVVPGLLTAFQSWPSFSGLTFHGLFN